MGVLVESRDTLRVVTIDNQEHRNALDLETFEGLGAAFSEAETDPDVRVLILTGAGRQAFCAGMDLRSFPRDGSRRLGRGPEVFTERLYAKPIVAAVNGAAVGGGLGLVLACDIAIGADNARFGLPEVQRGLIGAGAASRAAVRLAPAVAMELALTGDLIDAPRALALGLVSRVVAPENLMAAALAVAERIAANAPLAVMATKEVVYEAAALGRLDMASLRAKVAHVGASADAKEGAQAFIERRPPQFRGQ
jgi:enoyl-CoA hydratase/carnithine racemase